MDISQAILSDITVFQKYSKFIPEIHRRESWDELIDRNQAMHTRRYPHLKDKIRQVYRDFVRPKKVLPSMRSLQFAGAPIEISNVRIFNCAYMPIDHPFAFAELMFLLLSGTGVGYSVQNRHISKLPVIQGPTTRARRFLVGDSIEGWADAVKVLIKAYTSGKSDPVFDYRDIRPKGAALITSGGKAPGPDPLRICIDEIRSKLNGALGRRLTSLEVHDIACHIADAVLAGGIRRAAMIAMFDRDDLDMLSCKSGAWYELNPQRGRANNSAVLPRGEVTQEEFFDLWERVKNSGSGEPGFYWSNNLDWGANPCVEIGLNPNQFCNLVETNVSDVSSQEDLNARVEAAAFIATLQAGYTDFHYLRPVWRETTEREALIGVSMTGIASGAVLPFNLEEAAQCVIRENKITAEAIGINPAARTTCVKPAGSTSLVFGSFSGVHAGHAAFYVRRMRVGKNEPLYRYMVENFPSLIEDCKFKPHLEAVMSFPQKAPEGSILRSENVIDFLERVRRFNKEWVAPGHIEGDNMHNVSCTVSVKENEWEAVGSWMWDFRNDYTGISVLPYDGGTYVQAPFEDCTEEQFNEMISHLHAIDLTKVIEHDVTINHGRDSVACAGGACETGI